MKNLRKLPIALVTIFYFLIFTCNSSAQSVGINATQAAPDPSALLDLSSTNKGFLITRVDTASIITPVFGLMTLAPIDSCLYLFSGNKWMGIGGGGSDCSCNCKPSPSPFNCGDLFTDERDSEKYGTVVIGNQCWIGENLNYTTSSGSWCYNNDNNNCDTYGRLYDWSTASSMTSSVANPSGVQGVCPAGWHLPSDEEWKELEIYLNMSQADADGIGFRGTNQGDKLKATSFGGNNSSGFTALPGGVKTSTGSFFNGGSSGVWWTATESGLNAWTRYISNRSDVSRSTRAKGDGYSVRCVKN